MDTKNQNEKNANTGTHIDSVNSSPEDFIPYNEHEFMGNYPNELNPDLIDPQENENQYSPKNHEYESADDKSFRNLNNQITGNFINGDASNDNEKSQYFFSRNPKPNGN